MTRRPSTYALLALTFAACTDAELEGDRGPRADVDSLERDGDATSEEVSPDIFVDVTVETDIIVTTRPDSEEPDADIVVTDITPDVRPDADVEPDAGCTNDEQCRNQIGEGPCRAARCELATGTCIIVDTCGDCSSDRDCDDRAERCTRGTCDLNTGECHFEESGTCCSGPADCDDGDDCTTQQCDGGRCRFNRNDGLSPTCCVATPTINTSFAPAPDITATSQVDDAGFNVITSPFTPSPPQVLYLGNPDTQRIASSTGASYYAAARMRAGHAVAGARIEVKFMVFMDIRTSPADNLRVSLQGAAGTIFVWDRFSTNLYGEWHPVKVEVTAPGEGDYDLVLEYNSNTPPDAFETGVYFDDVQVRMGCQEGGCDPGDTCPSNDPCVFGFCNAEGICQFTPIPNCGCNDTSCDDGDDCTIDKCDADGQCLNEAIVGCCDSNGDCSDGDPCTRGTCENGQCRQEVLPIPGCGTSCQNDDGCDDNNPCTNDQCTAIGICQNTPTVCDDGFDCTIDVCDPGVGCVFIPTPDCQCTPEILWSRAFEQGETPDINTNDGTGGGITWRVDGLDSHSPTRAFRYGKQDGSNYSNGTRTWGRATGPEIDVPDSAAGVTLRFWTKVDVDDDLDHDFFVARLLRGGLNDAIWSRAELEGGNTNGEWRQVTIQLPNEVIGETIQIRWIFDSLDGDENDGTGVYIDDVVLETTCPETL